MRIDLIKYALDNVMHRKMRSWLTVISVLIGITAIYALVSFGQGLSYYVSEMSSQMGTDKLLIQSKGTQAAGIDLDFSVKREEIDFLKSVNGIDEVVGIYVINAEVEHNKEKRYTFGISIPVEGKGKQIFEEMMAVVELYKGRALKKGDKLKVLLGYNYMFPDNIFKKPVKLGDKIKVNGKEVEVIGFYGEVGNPQDDSQVYFTDEGMLLIDPSVKDKFPWAMGRTAKGFEPSEVADRAAERLRKFKGQKEGKEDFFIQTFEQAMETFTNIMAVINGVLVLIALISLVVAGVNIMNTMYTAVLERTKEIGVMKAIGAKNKDIMAVFILESGFLGLVGGILGVLAGYGVAKLGGAIAANAGYSLLKPYFPWQLTLGCLLFAFFVGAFAGFLPARQAAKLRPVEALRYE